MRRNVWMKAPCESGACVEILWGTRCESGNCVEVGFQSGCDSSTCVEVAHPGDVVLVRDSKNPDGQVLAFPAAVWEALCEDVRAGHVIDWAGVFHPLEFDAEEIAAFVRGVMSGGFVPVTA